MTKFPMLAAAAVAALAAACAGNQSARTETQSATSSSAPSTSSAPADTSTPAPADQTQTPTSPDQGQATPGAPGAQTSFTDDQLRRFAAAAMEIDPISRSVASQTPEQRAASTEQIRQILARNNLDSDTYNAIAAQAQADPALAARIASLHRADQSAG